jgi:hypothetical protein
MPEWMKKGSNGYVSFRINLKSDSKVGTVVKNHAEIYFDKNQPILTNETFHTLFVALLTQVYSSTNYILPKCILIRHKMN